MDHIWRAVCLHSWSFVHNYRNETWKGTFKRKKLTQGRMTEGKSEDFVMVPLRAHKNFVTALHMMEGGIISGDVNGDILYWTEDDTQFAEDDPDDAFAPVNIQSSGKEIKEFLMHPSNKFVSAFALDNVLEVFDYNPEERKIKHKRKIVAEYGDITFVKAYEDNILVYNIREDEILLYNCESGLCIQRIPTNGNKPIANQMMLPIVQSDEVGKNLVAVWKQYLFTCFGKYEGVNFVQYLEKYDLKHQKIVGSIGLPVACQGITISGDTLILIMQDRLMLYDPNAFKLLGAHSFAAFVQNYFSVFNNGPEFTAYLVRRLPFDIKAFSLNPSAKKYKEIKLSVAYKEGHKANINSITNFENKLATGSADMSIAVWDMLTGKRLYSLLGKMLLTFS